MLPLLPSDYSFVAVRSVPAEIQDISNTTHTISPPPQVLANNTEFDLPQSEQQRPHTSATLLGVPLSVGFPLLPAAASTRAFPQEDILQIHSVERQLDSLMSDRSTPNQPVEAHESQHQVTELLHPHLSNRDRSSSAEQQQARDRRGWTVAEPSASEISHSASDRLGQQGKMLSENGGYRVEGISPLATAKDLETVEDIENLETIEDIKNLETLEDIENLETLEETAILLRRGSANAPSLAIDTLEFDLAPDLDQAATDKTVLPSSAFAQVTSVSQLSDVLPTDWAFGALQSLVESYDCATGYPDSTFQGHRSLNRYEFAAGLKACLDRVSELTAIHTSDRVSQTDLQVLKKLKDEFTAELATLRGNIDVLEARTAELEANQFSTTARLGGQVIFAFADALGGNPPGRGNTNAVLAQLTQLQIAASFTGKDVLRLGLATGSFGENGFTNPQALNTQMSLLSFQSDLDNRLLLNSLEYRTAAFDDRVVFTFAPVGFSLHTVLSANSSYTDAGQEGISRFASLSPIFRIGDLDAGLGVDWLATDRLRLQLAYGSRGNRRGSVDFFGADHSAFGAQMLYKPHSTVIAGLAYVNAYANDAALDTFTGSTNADISGGFNEPAKINAFNATLRWRVLPNVTLGAWGGFAVSSSLKSDAITLGTTYQASVGISDPFGRDGDLLAFLFGQPPKLSAGLLVERIDESTSLHYEVFYRFQLNDNISITPGFFVVTNPGHIVENNTIFVGTIRTTFRF